MTEKQQKLDILSFNVEGLDSILNDPSFHTLIENHDICFLTETMRKDDSKLGINGFWDHSLIRLKLKKEGRFSGGISVLVKTHLRNGVKIAHCSEGFLCIRLIKSFFNLPSDLYICGTYIPPYNTSKEILAKTDYFHELISLSNKFKELGNILILGDLNSRIGCNDDSLNNPDIPFLDDIIPAFCSTPKLPARSACDRTINQYGRKLNTIINDLDLFVANGRVPGDNLGNFTCFTSRGRSTVDLVISSIKHMGILLQSLRPYIVLYRSLLNIFSNWNHNQPPQPFLSPQK